MVKQRSALLIEGTTKKEVVKKAALYLCADDSAWEWWNAAEKYMSGGWFAMLVLKSAPNKPSRRDRGL